jgi:hypothetical protein
MHQPVLEIIAGYITPPMPDPLKPDPRAVQLMKKLRMMEQWKEDAWAHGKSGTEALCGILRSRQSEKMDRLLAAQMLCHQPTAR